MGSQSGVAKAETIKDPNKRPSRKVRIHKTALTKGEFGGTPTGTVTLKNGSTALATVKLSGIREAFVTSSLSVGTHSITASYTGDTDYLASTSAVLKQTVKRR